MAPVSCMGFYSFLAPQKPLFTPSNPIGDQLKDKYDGATEVKINRRGKLQVKHPHFNVPTGEDLVYLLESPDYCKRNTTVGSLGKVSSMLHHKNKPYYILLMKSCSPHIIR